MSPFCLSDYLRSPTCLFFSRASICWSVCPSLICLSITSLCISFWQSPFCLYPSYLSGRLAVDCFFFFSLHIYLFVHCMLPVYLIVLSLRISLSIYYSFACLWLFTLSVHRICVYHSLRRLSSTIDYLLAYISLSSSASSFSSCPPPPFSSSNCLLFLIFFFKKILISSLFCLRLIYLLSVGLSDILCLSFAFVSARLSSPVCLFTYS